VVCEGASRPLVGALLVLPALAATGLVDAAEKVLGLPRAAFYSLRSLLLALVFVPLLGEPGAEGASRVDPVAMSRLIGLDRGPEVKTLRWRVEALAGLRRSGQLLVALARHHADAHPEAMGVLYVDGHVRAYHGGSDLPRAHLVRAPSRLRPSTPTR
jgi:prepilin-type processing-associated H-X9-DG protein